MALAIAVLAAAALIAGLALAACSGGQRNGDVLSEAADEVSNAAHVAEATAHLENAYSVQTYALDPQDMLAISDAAEIMPINLSGGSPEAPDDAALSDVRAVLAAIEERGDCGFVFFDVSNGHGFAYNAGEEMYIASSAKAPFACYLLSSGADLSEYDRQNIEWAIVDSENEAFEDVYMSHIGEGYIDWMSHHGVYHDNYYGDFYPPMSARSLASIWADILLYTQGGSSDGAWLGSLLSSTTVSFIRDGLSGTGAEVMNKAGWINEGAGAGYYEDEDSDEGGWWYETMEYRAVADAAIVESDGNTYLMAIVTSQPDSDSAEANVSELARALFDLRSLL